MIDGGIRFEDIGRTFGFSSFLRHTTVTGAEFRQIMEAGYRGIGGSQGYYLVVPDFLYGGGDGYQIPKDRFASRPGSELKYLVLDAIIMAQAQGRRIGGQWMRLNPRYVELGLARVQCFP